MAECEKNRAHFKQRGRIGFTKKPNFSKKCHFWAISVSCSHLVGYFVNRVIVHSASLTILKTTTRNVLQNLKNYSLFPKKTVVGFRFKFSKKRCLVGMCNRISVAESNALNILIVLRLVRCTTYFIRRRSYLRNNCF